MKTLILEKLSTLEKLEKLEKYIYTFEEIHKPMLNICGSKAINLSILWANDRSFVPAGVVIGAQLVRFVRKNGKYPYKFIEDLTFYLKKVEEVSGKAFGDYRNPLLVSVRSSGNISIPGVLDTILNVGINSEIREKWQVKKEFKEELYKNNLCSKLDHPMDQLLDAINLVINSIDKEKFRVYDLDETKRKNFTMGIVIQEMVFGNRDENSYTGVVFSSDKTGEKIFGEVLQKCQGDAIVSGVVTPDSVETLPSSLYKQIFDRAKELEKNFKYIQDIEFTIESGKLYILQTRNAQLTNVEKFQMLERFVRLGWIGEKEFFKLAPSLAEVRNKRINYQRESPNILGKGLGVTESVVCGYLAMDYESIMELKEEGRKAIYATIETSQNHMKCLMAADGFITVKGGATSHSAVVARGRNMVCILSVVSLEILKNGINIHKMFVKNKSPLTLDGYRGHLLEGLVNFEDGAEYLASCYWPLSKITVKMNGETLEDIHNGHKFDMKGIGLCRIEHMLLEEEGKKLFQNLILKPDEKAESLFCEYLTRKFMEIFQHIKNLPISIRLIDPPLHEFFPIDSLMEHNPMMGNRGARLLITQDSLCELQIESIFVAYKLSGSSSSLEIMVPFIFDLKELKYVKSLIKNVAKNFPEIAYKFGVMIEIPRAVFIADKLAEEVDFMAFGTNDLTQMVLGLSRDDSGCIIQKYMEKKLLNFDPFQRLDRVICELIEITINKAKSVNKNMIFGICGEQATDESSIEFLHKVGINYISCSPFHMEKVRFTLNKLSAIEKED